MNPLTILVGINTSAVLTGLGKLKGKFAEVGEEISSEFGPGKLLAAGGLIAGLHSAFEEAGQIVDTADRFGVAVEGLQRITNAAKENGVSMEGVAKGLNKLSLAQEEVRGGNEKLTTAVQELGLKAEDFINMTPEEAFYAIADGVKEADDRTAAYANVTALMGKNSGELFTTLEQGADAIKKIGDNAGVMSEATARALDAAGDRIEGIMHKIKMYGAEALGFLVKIGETLYAGGQGIAGGMVWVVDQKAGAEMIEKANQDILDTWSEKGLLDPSARDKLKRDLEDTQADIEKRAATEEKLAQANERIADEKHRQLLEEMDVQSRISQLIEDRYQAQRRAEKETDPLKRAEAELEAEQVLANLNRERKRVADEEDRKADQIAKKKEQLAKKDADAELDALTTVAEKRALLEQRKRDLEDKIAGDGDESKNLDLQLERADLQRQISGLKDEKVKEAAKVQQEVIASSLARIGAGGSAFLSTKADAADRTAKATEKALQKADEVKRKLDTIADKLDTAKWAP